MGQRDSITRTFSIWLAVCILCQRCEHRRRRVDGDQLLDVQCDRQRVPAAAGANVEPRVARLRERQEDVHRLVVGTARVHAEAVGGRRVEVGRIGFLARALDLLLVGRHAVAPGSQQIVDRR